jgi:hypothetical protein
MKPELLTSSRTSPLEVEYMQGGIDELLNDLQIEASESGIVLQGNSVTTVFELLMRASFGLLKYRRDVRLIVSALPQPLFEIRFDLLDWQNQPVGARLFVIEAPPIRVKLLGWHLKKKSQYFESDRARQTQAALNALQRAIRSG